MRSKQVLSCTLKTSFLLFGLNLRGTPRAGMKRDFRLRFTLPEKYK